MSELKSDRFTEYLLNFSGRSRDCADNLLPFAALRCVEDGKAARLSSVRSLLAIHSLINSTHP
ncbi:MAG TPA: hypothetical protein V6D48_11185 [Oculatellaceae cyanobacterium]